MAVNPLKIFLFLIGGSVAAGATAFVSGVLDPYIYGKGAGAASVAALPAPSDPSRPKGERLGEETPPNSMMAAAPPADEAATPPADPVAPPPNTMAAQPPADAAAPPAGPPRPSFDVVRVESDGSVVIAGKAMADALVELLNGEIVLGSARATPEGDFAIVLDEPLKPGDYQLTLRATPAGGAAVASVETAVLSVPDKPDGQVLAMVEKPGEASELLTVPQPAAPAEARTEDAAPPTDVEKPADVASAPAETTPPAEEPKTEEAAAPPAQEEKPAEVAPAETTPPADAPKTDEAAMAPALEEKHGEAPKTEEAATPPAQEEKPAEVASAPAETTPPAEPAPAPVEAKVAVEAVEIDGRKIFVAGVGDPGRFVRVYANEIVLGETRVGEGGRFLIEAERDLPVGEYIIRADLLDADGIKVVARAAVPFEREPGETIAAVAPGVEQPPEPPADVAAAEPEQPPAPADTGKPAEAAETDQARPPAGAAGAGEPDAPPKPEQPAMATEDEPPPATTEPAAPPDVAETPPAAPQPEQPATAAEDAPPAATEPAAPPDVAETPPAAPQPGQPAAAAEDAPPPAATEPAAPEVAAGEPDQPPAEAAPPAAEAEIAAAPPETVSPKLQKVQGSVIIRRGDTLWRISRRVYGRGIRYSTIYLANQTQIADPDRIWPGQIFSVPDKSKEGEAADMSAMGDQMVRTTTSE
jgi:nucleoid-associated protein YgaU